MTFNIGDILEGKVTKIITAGIFVDIGNGQSGFVHISELSHSYIPQTSDFANVGDVVKVKIISIDANNKIGLSIKQLVPFKPTVKKNNTQKNNISFEDMLKNFKTSSEQKMCDIKRNINNKQGRTRRKRK